MFKKLVEENIIIKISVNQDITVEQDSYTEFMRNVILNTSGLN